MLAIRKVAPVGGATASADTLPQRLQALSGRNLGQLREEWRKLYHVPPPARLSRDLLSRGIAYKLQEAAYGGLQPATRRTLAALARALAAENEGGAVPAIRLRAGAILVREWRGRSNAVLVLEDGFEYQGKRYASLSHVARQITGAHWSGPRFFGVSRAAKPFTTAREGSDANGKA